jgi:DNA polymerase-3 subunit delta'
MDSGKLGHGVVGHTAVLRILESWLEHPAHGYLFSGMPHLGKHAVAERFVAAMLGIRFDDLHLESNVHPDFIILEPEEGKTQISVDLVRRARARLSERPMVAPRVVLYVPDANRMNDEGWNALLKVIEEPPAGAVFVFVANDVSRLPATVMSRVTRIPFETVPAAEIASGLIARGLSEADAQARAKECRGRPGLAIEPQERDELEVKRFLIAKKLGDRLAIVDRLAVSCEGAENPIDAWIAALETWAEVCRRSLPHLLETSIAASEGVIAARRFVGGPLSPRLPLEAAALRMTSKRPLVGIFPSLMPHALPSIFEYSNI